MVTTLCILVIVGFRIQPRAAIYGLVFSFIVDGLLIARFG